MTLLPDVKSDACFPNGKSLFTMKSLVSCSGGVYIYLYIYVCVCGIGGWWTMGIEREYRDHPSIRHTFLTEI